MIKRIEVPTLHRVNVMSVVGSFEPGARMSGPIVNVVMSIFCPRFLGVRVAESRAGASVQAMRQIEDGNGLRHFVLPPS